MKKKLLFITLSLFFFYATSQTVTWTGNSGIDNDWNTDGNWDTGSIPTAINDVVIPDGFTVDLDAPGADIASLSLGNSVFNLNTTFKFTNTFTISANATVNWNPSTIDGGVITNDGTINVIGTVAHYLGGFTVGSTLDNNNIINIMGTGDIFIRTNSVLNNKSSGVIDCQLAASGISKTGVAPHILNNEGIIKATPPLATDQVTINVQVNNNNGTIQVESGILNLPSNAAPNTNSFTDGFFNIFSGATMNITNTAIHAGTHQGAINGTLNMNSFISVPVAATFDFGGTEIINYTATVIGGGTLTNKNILTIGNQPTRIQESSTLINQDRIEFTGFGDLFVQTGSTLNNDASGIIDFKGDTGNILASLGTPNVFTNTGLIKTSFTGDGSDTAEITAQLSNNGGTIEINNGTLSLNKIGIALNGGIYNIASDGIFDWDDDVAISGSLTGNIQGLLNWNSKVIITGAASLDFGGTETITWVIGNIDGGGVLTNNNIINIGNFTTNIFGGTTINNNDTINITDDDDFIIATNGVFNNQMLGTLNLLGDGASVGNPAVTNQGTFNNFGDIIVDLPNDTDEANIYSKFNNNNATIEIRKGILNMNNVTPNEQNLLDGVYNVFADGTFNWENDLTLSGELTGQVDGPINWKDALRVNAATTATLFFTGQKTIFWSQGSLNGGGTLLNRSIINSTNTGNVNVNDGTTFDNGGDFIFSTFGDLGITTSGTLNNLVEGSIEFQVAGASIFASGAGSQTFNNLGELKTFAPGVIVLNIDTNNSGSIEINSGELEFSDTSMFHNQTTGIIKGTGILDLPPAANFTNDGTIAPGTSPGTLTILGDYSSTSSAVLDIELDGLVQGTDFDFIPITGNDVVFEGSVDITLGFNANINDEFIIATTSGTPGTIMTCNLDSPSTASFGGNNYEFDVICRNDNEVVLTVAGITLSTIDNELADNSISIFPNPAKTSITLKNESNISLINAFIIDINGTIIEDINLEGAGDQTKFSILNYASGIYFIKINSENSTVVKKLVKL